MANTIERPTLTQDHQPGTQAEMNPRPIEVSDNYRGSEKLAGKAAIVTGGDSGIGRSVALYFAMEGADVAIVYLNEGEDARETKEKVEKIGRRCLAFAGDIGDETFCRRVVGEVKNSFGKIDILVNNAAEQHPQESLADISAEQLERTFRTNVFSMFFLAKAVLPHLGEGSTIINTASVTQYKGAPELLDYSATKGAITAFTRSLALSLADKKIRVNGVAPGPIWTPLIPSSLPPEKVATFGQDVPLKRVGQPAEVAPSYVFLASEDSSYITGQMIHPNGGSIVNS